MSSRNVSSDEVEIISMDPYERQELEYLRERVELLEGAFTSLNLDDIETQNVVENVMESVVM